MNAITQSLKNNLSIWRWHLGLWGAKLLTIWLGYLTLSGTFNTFLGYRNTADMLWTKTDFNYFYDLIMRVPGGALASVFSIMVALMVIWFVLDSFFDVAIIDALSGRENGALLPKVTKVLWARLIFWLPYLLVVGALIYGAIKFWTKFYAWWPLLLVGFLGAFITFFLLKWLDIAKIMIVTENSELKPALSEAGRLLFEDMGQTLQVNITFAILITFFIYLGIAVNIHFIAHSLFSLWILWLVRQMMVILRQYLRYGFTGAWIAFRQQ